MSWSQIGVRKRDFLSKGRRFSPFQTAPTCTTIGSVWTFFLPSNAMSSDRPNLTLDEQSFQGLLSAAFIIQQHNDRRKLAREAQAEPETRVQPETNIDREI